MILAAYRDNAYDFVLLLHIASIIVAFAPAVAHPLGSWRARTAGGQAAVTAFSAAAAQNTRTVYLPALLVTGLTGIALVILADDVIGFAETWVSLAFLVWFALGGVVSGMIMPAERKLGEGDASAERRITLGGQIATVLVLVMLYLMIFKPGADVL